MEITNSWVQITYTAGFGALLQNGGNNAIQIAYATSEVNISSVYSLSSRKVEKFPNKTGNFIFARSIRGSTVLNAQEVDFSSTVSSSAVSGSGFIDYNDSSTVATPITLTTDTWTNITNDGLGSFTNKVYSPAGVTDLMNNLGELDFSELPLGSAVLIRNDFSIIPSINNTIVDARYLLGAGASEYALSSTVSTMSHGSGVSYQFALQVNYLYMGDTNTRDNLVKFQLRTSYDSTVINAGSVIHVLGK